MIEVDVPGHAKFDPDTTVGVKLPDPAGVLVEAS